MLPILAVVAAAVLFGTTGTTQALGPDSATPLSVGVARLVIGGTTLAAIGLGIGARHRRRAHAVDAPPPRMTGRVAVLMAVTGVCLALYQPLFFVGTARGGVAVGTVIALGSAPVLAGLLEWALTRRPPGRVWTAATALATLGVVVLAAAGGEGGAADPVGILGSLGAGASFAVFANAQRRLLDAGWDPFTVAGAMGAGSAICGALALPFVDLRWLTEPGGVSAALWLGVATIGVAYTLFTWGLQRLTAATAATLTLAEPLTAGLLGVLLLGEQLSPAAVAGLAVLTAGLVLLAVGAARTDRTPLVVELQATDDAALASPAARPALELRRDDLTGAAVRRLVALHLAGMRETSPPESVHALDVDALRTDGVRFFSAWRGDDLVGIGAVRRLGPHDAELKSMRVADEHRGTGAGRAVLLHLLEQCRADGVERVWLETGTHDAFEPARRLYAAHGFVPCEPFGDYAVDPHSVFMTRTL